MKKLPATYEWIDTISDGIPPDNSLSRSSSQNPKVAEEIIPAPDCDTANSRVATDSEAALSASNLLAAGEERAPANTDGLFRKEYIQRLSNMKIIRPQRPSKPHQTLVIFDWDDTLFPTTFLKHVGFDKIDSDAKIRSSLSKIDNCVSKLLQKAVRVGVTYIITNAVKNWVEMSCEKCLPITYKFIKNNQISVISARSEYEKQYPNEPKRWKQEAFLVLKGKLECSVLTNIICVGDSTAELEAAQQVSRVLDQAILKTIKFKSAPRLEELVKQQTVVIDKFDQIYMTLRSLTIKVEKKN